VSFFVTFWGRGVSRGGNRAKMEKGGNPKKGSKMAKNGVNFGVFDGPNRLLDAMVPEKERKIQRNFRVKKKVSKKGVWAGICGTVRVLKRVQKGGTGVSHPGGVLAGNRKRGSGDVQIGVRIAGSGQKCQKGPKSDQIWGRFGDSRSRRFRLKGGVPKVAKKGVWGSYYYTIICKKGSKRSQKGSKKGSGLGTLNVGVLD
jgi:hypothetical protein